MGLLCVSSLVNLIMHLLGDWISFKKKLLLAIIVLQN